MQCVIAQDLRAWPSERTPHTWQHDWSGLAGSVRDHRGMLNFIYRRGLKSANVRVALGKLPRLLGWAGLGLVGWWARWRGRREWTGLPAGLGVD